VSSPRKWNVAAVATKLGTDRILWASDYPHPEYHEGIVDELRERIAPLDARDRTRILGTNAVRVLRIGSLTPAQALACRRAETGMHRRCRAVRRSRDPRPERGDAEAQSFRRALDDAGLEKDDIDGLASAGYGGMHEVALAEYLGLTPTWLESSSVGGSMLRVPRDARVPGHPERRRRDGRHRLRQQSALGVRGAQPLGSRRGGGGGSGAGHVVAVPMSYEFPTGLTLVGAYAMAAQRHMHEYGTTAEQLASIAVQTREHAGRNPTRCTATRSLSTT